MDAEWISEPSRRHITPRLQDEREKDELDDGVKLKLIVRLRDSIIPALKPERRLHINTGSSRILFQRVTLVHLLSAQSILLQAKVSKDSYAIYA